MPAHPRPGRVVRPARRSRALGRSCLLGHPEGPDHDILAYASPPVTRRRVPGRRPGEGAQGRRTALVANAAALTTGTDLDVMTSLALATAQVYEALQERLNAIWSWQLALRDLAYPEALRDIVEDLTAHRYDHPPKAARAVGQAIAALEGYLAEHDPTGTTHPARKRVEC